MGSSRKRAAGPGGFSGSALKYIAMCSMLLDHIGVVILERIVYYRGGLEQIARLMTSDWGGVLYALSRVLRTAGRLAFPIYCFLLVEGFLHTRDWRRYWVRLAAFALISELPFSLAVYNQWVGRSHNVFFELAAGLLVLQGLRQCEALRDPVRQAGGAAVICAGCAAACLMRADYDLDGILIISAFYLLRERRLPQALAGCGLSFLDSMEQSYGAGALAAFPILLYNGRKGETRWKYVFYWFYPLHLLLLFIIRRFLIGIPLE